MLTASQLVEEILLAEGRVEDVRKQYPDIPQETYDYLVQNDPSKNHKYLQWMAKIWDWEEPTDAQTIIKLVGEFDKKIQGKDLYTFKSLRDLRDALEERVPSKKERLRDDAELIYDDDDWLVVAPLTHEASMHYGGGTRWCVATSTCQHWDNYFESGLFVFIKNRNLPERDAYWKVAIHAQGEDERRWSFYDTNDHSIRMSDVQGMFDDQINPDGVSGEEILGKIADYISSNIDSHIDDQAEKRYEREQEEAEEQYERGGKEDLLGELAGWIGAEDADEVEEILKSNGWTDEQVDNMTRRVWYGSISYHGHDQAGYVRNLDQFYEFIEDGEITTSLEYALAGFGVAGEALRIIQHNLGPDYRELEVKYRDDLLKILKYATVKAKGQLTASERGQKTLDLNTANRAEEFNVPMKTMDDVLRMLDQADEHTLVADLQRMVRESLTIENALALLEQMNVTTSEIKRGFVDIFYDGKDVGSFGIDKIGDIPIDPYGYFSQHDPEAYTRHGFDLQHPAVFKNSILLSGGFIVRDEFQRKGIGRATISKIFSGSPQTENIFLYALGNQGAVDFWKKIGGRVLLSYESPNGLYYIQIKR